MRSWAAMRPSWSRWRVILRHRSFLGGRACGEQPELQRLAEVVAHRPVFDHLAVPKAPDVDVLDGEFPARRGRAEELAEVAAVHGHARDDLVAFADLVL